MLANSPNVEVFEAMFSFLIRTKRFSQKLSWFTSILPFLYIFVPHVADITVSYHTCWKAYFISTSVLLVQACHIILFKKSDSFEILEKCFFTLF